MTLSCSSLLAILVQASAKIHEESYDRESSDKAEKENDAKRDAAEPHMKHYCVVDYSQFYRMTLQEAAEEACRRVQRSEPGQMELAYPVYLLLQMAWNDALDWSNNPEAYLKK